ncbi:TcaA NTF2-like domain-containing protein [Ornithinibacillus gellani]|uniref:TcaA NTF2-like domain-containing protein n=1 Tax=Ornithinibacillus gellani TaxID=2293253 RepID=UPI0016816C5D|nr:zinc-ribbon domain-containing protein [Ornithinibacillus gellani]
MKFCKECGHEIKDGRMQFCTNCGHEIAASKSESTENKQVQGNSNQTPTGKAPTHQAPEQAPTHQAAEKAPTGESATNQAVNQTTGQAPAAQMKPPKQPMSKKNKKKLILLSGVAALLMVLYFIGSYFTSHERVVDKFAKAIEDKDAAAIAKQLHYRDIDTEIEKVDAEGFLAYLEEYPEDAEEIIEFLDQQSAVLKKGNANKNNLQGKWESMVDTIFGSSDAGVVTLEKAGKFLFYDTYELTIDPVYVTVYSNLANTKLFINDEEKKTLKKAEEELRLGPMLPGRYKLAAVFKGDFAELQKEEEMLLTGSDEYVNFDFEVAYLNFNLPEIPDAEGKVVLNGKAVDFNPFKTENFGPVTEDAVESLAVSISFPWGDMQSEDVDNMNWGYDNVPVRFHVTDELVQEITNTLQTYSNTYMEAWANNDIGKLGNIHADLKEEYKYDFENAHEGYYFQEKKINGMEMVKEIAGITYEDKAYYVDVNVLETYESDRYYDLDDRDPSEQENYYQYTLRYDDDGWTVYNKKQPFYYDLEADTKLDIQTDLYTVKGAKYEGKVRKVDTKKKDSSKKEDKKDDKKKDAEKSDDTAKAASKSDIQSTTLNYIEYLVEAINENNYDLVQPYIIKGSALDDMQKDLVKRLNKNGTTQEVISAEVVDIAEKGDKWIVTTNETIRIIDKDGNEKTKDYVWKYTVESDGESIGLTNIEE